MNILALSAVFGLALVFACSGFAKLADSQQGGAGIAQFGVPASVAAAAPRLLGFTEVAIAAALVPTATSAIAATVAGGLLLLFTAVIIANLLRGRRPACRCFGRLSSRSIGWGSVCRNLALAGVAAVVVFIPPRTDLIAWLSDPHHADRLGFVLAGLFAACTVSLAWLLLTVLRRYGRLLLTREQDRANLAVARSTPRVSGLAPGTRAPEFDAKDVDGLRASLSGLTALGRPVILLFIDTRCDACQSALAAVARWGRQRMEMTVAVIGAGQPAELVSIRDRHNLPLMLMDVSPALSIARRYTVQQTPSAVVVDASGTIAGSAIGTEAITRLVAEQVGAAHPLQPGDQFPAIDGTEGALGRLVGGRPTFIVFADPDCPGCFEFTRELPAPELDRTGIGLLVVSPGQRTNELRPNADVRILRDDENVTANAIGLHSVPSAALVDADGRLAAPIAEGPSAVRLLAWVCSHRPIFAGQLV